MKIAIASDLHSNCFATEAFIKDMYAAKADRLFILGDIFGYYPWAFKTYELIKNITIPVIVIKGNHDQFILDKVNNKSLNKEVSYWFAIEQNIDDLGGEFSQPVKWLSTLAAHIEIKTQRFTYSLYHGTPDDELNGRLYPDDNNLYDWFPDEKNILLLGHTHYPLLKKTTDGRIINPGSIGQPRDGNICPSWALFDEESGQIEILRVNYNVQDVVEKLIALNWDIRAIEALKKDKPGSLKL